MNIPFGQKRATDVFTTATHFRSSDLTGRRLQTTNRTTTSHKNMSLGCRNISVVETYRRGNAPCPPGLDSWAWHARRSYLPSVGTFVSLSLRSRKHETDRRPTWLKKNRSTRRASLIVLIISVTQSIRRAVSWLPGSLRNFSILSRLGLPPA